MKGPDLSRITMAYLPESFNCVFRGEMTTNGCCCCPGAFRLLPTVRDHLSTTGVSPRCRARLSTFGMPPHRYRYDSEYRTVKVRDETTN